jgi:flagellar biosynthesis protein FlhA
VQVIGLDTPLERLLFRHCKAAVGWSRALPIVCWSKPGSVAASGDAGAPPVLLVNHALRPLLSRLRRSLPQLVVLSNMEMSR